MAFRRDGRRPCAANLRWAARFQAHHSERPGLGTGPSTLIFASLKRPADGYLRFARAPARLDEAITKPPPIPSTLSPEFTLP